MFKNYFKVAFRSLVRNKVYALINIAGLGVGIAACLLVYLVIRYETSFDDFHANKDRIYRVVSETNTPEGMQYSAGVPYPTPRGLRTDFPQLEKVAPVYRSGEAQFTVLEADGSNGKKFKEDAGIFFAGGEFFEMFDFPWLAGDPKTGLSAPNTVALSRATAVRYFGDWKNVVGRTISYRNSLPLKVTGVIEDAPVNSDFQMKIVISHPTHGRAASEDWISVSSSANCYVLLPPGMEAEELRAQLPAFVKKHKPAEYVKDGMNLQPLREVHFDERYGNFSFRTFSKDLIASLALVGIFLLVIACVNFINLATAQAVNRSREVGVRKVLGGNRRQLIAQFMGETGLVSLIALSLGVLIARLTLPALNALLEVHITMDGENFAAIAGFLALALLAVTFLSGYYPALVLSRFDPVAALKSKGSGKKRGITLRRGLVIFQFTVAQVMIIGMLVVVKQMDFFRQTSLGFNKDAVVTMPLPADSLSFTKIESFRQELLKNPGVESVSFSFASPADVFNWSSNFFYDHAEKETDFNASLKWSDTSYFRTYGLQLVAGRPYAQSDTVREFVVNETLLKKLGVARPEDALGKEINFWGQLSAPIVGVVKDFHNNSLHSPVDAVVMGAWRDRYSMASLRVHPEKTKDVLAAAGTAWNRFFPDYIYEYEFLDERIAGYYESEAQLSALYKIFAGIAVFISCLGLYGLVSFMAVQRRKEVGIRKVLGASVGQIVYLFSREFMLLVGVAFILAAPLAYYLMQRWLEDFAFRIDLEWWILGLACVAALLIAFATVSFQAVRAALANPVKSIRTE